MEITWIENIGSGNEEAFLGKICIGNIIWKTQGYSVICHAHCVLPDIDMHIREFATYEQVKEDYVDAVRRWLLSAGLL